MAAAPIVLGITIRADGSAQVQGELNNIRAGLTNAGTAAGNTSRSFATMARETLNVGNALKGIMAGFTALALFQSAKDIIMLADKMTLLDSRIKVATKSVDDYRAASAALTQISLATGASLESNIIMFGRLNKSVESAGGSYQTTLGLVKTLNEGLKISGASAEESRSVMIQLSQALSSGVLRGDEFNSVMENGSRIVEALTTATGKTRGELRALAADGKLTSEIVIGAMQQQAAAIHDDFAKIPLTIGAALENINTSFSRYIENLNKSSGATNGFAQSLNGISQNLTPIISGIVTLGEVAIAVFAGSMAASLGGYITARRLAAQVEAAHTLAIAENNAMAIASMQGTVARLDVQLGYIRAQQAAVLAEQATLASSIAASAAIMNQARATLIATDSMIQSTSVIWIRNQALGAMTGADIAATEATALLTAAQARQGALSGQIAMTIAAQSSATATLAAANETLAAAELAAAEGTATLGLSFGALLSPLNLVNIGLAAFVGWEIGDFLNKFETVRRVANDVLYSVATALEAVSYQWDKFNAKAGDKAGIEAAHLAQTTMISDLISETNSYVKSGDNAAAATAGQGAALKAFSVNIDETAKKHKAKKEALTEEQKAANSLQAAYESLAASQAKEIALGGDSSKLLALEYDLESGALKALTQEKKLYLLQQAQEIQHNEITKKETEAQNSALDSLKDKYNQLTLSARDYYQSQLTGQGVKASAQGPIMAQFDKNTSAQGDLDAEKLRIDARNASMQRYDAIIKQVESSTQKLGATNAGVIDSALGGVNTLAAAFENMAKSIIETTLQQKELNDAYNQEKSNISTSKLDDRQKYTLMLGVEGDQLKANKKLDDDKTNAALTGTRQMIGATANMFDQKSSAAKALHGVEQGIAVAQLVMQGIQMAKTVAATAASMAAGAAKFFEQSGWWGFAGVAAMAAVMAGLGLAMSSGGGGQSTPIIPTSSPDTGTVLGDATAKSMSIDKTYTLLKDIQAQNYPILKGINEGIAGLGVGISGTITRLYQSGGISNFAVLAPKTSGGFLDSIFGGGQSQSVIGQGLSTIATLLSSVMSGGNLQAYQYAQIQTKTSGGWFSDDSYSTSYQYAALDAKTQKALNDIFSNVGKTMLSLADNLGVGLSGMVQKYVIPALTVNLTGLSGTDAATKLNGVISTALDTMSTAVFGKIIGQYQKLGEGMMETAVRIVAEVAVVKDALASSSIKLVNNVIAVSDALVNAAGSLKDFQSQFATFFDKFYSATEKQTKLQAQLSSQLGDVGLSLADSRAGYKAQVEAIDITTVAGLAHYSVLLKLAGAADTYYTALEAATALAKSQSALDQQYMILTGKAVEALTLKRKEEIAALDKSLQITQQLIYLMTDANKAVADATAVVTKSITDAMTLAAKSVSDAVNTVSKSIGNLQSVAAKLRAALPGVTTASLEDRSGAMTVLNAALTATKTGGSIDNFSGMTEALATIAKPSEQLYSTFTDYAREQAQTSDTITQLADYADLQVSDAQKQIDAINGTTAEVIGIKIAVSNLTDAQKTLATVQDQKTQIEKMLGNNLAVISVGDAIANLAAALNAQNATTKAIAIAQAAAKASVNAELVLNAANAKALVSANALASAQGNSSSANTTTASAQAAANALTLTETSLKKALAVAVTAQAATMVVYKAHPDWRNAWQQEVNAEANLAAAQNALSSAQSSLKAANATLATSTATAAAVAALVSPLAKVAAADASTASSALATYQTASAYAAATQSALPAFASGGLHTGGWRLVGENGPELENTGPSQIFSNSQSKSMLNNDDLIAEIKALREEVSLLRAEARATASHTNKTAKILERVMPDGDAISVRTAA